jgi:hypothetical protein
LKQNLLAQKLLWNFDMPGRQEQKTGPGTPPNKYRHHKQYRCFKEVK